MVKKKLKLGSKKKKSPPPPKKKEKKSYTIKNNYMKAKKTPLIWMIKKVKRKHVGIYIYLVQVESYFRKTQK